MVEILGLESGKFLYEYPARLRKINIENVMGTNTEKILKDENNICT